MQNTSFANEWGPDEVSGGHLRVSEKGGLTEGGAYLSRTYIRKLKCKFVFWLVLGRFPATIGFGTVPTDAA